MSEQLNDTLDVARAVPRSFRFSKPFWASKKKCVWNGIRLWRMSSLA